MSTPLRPHLICTSHLRWAFVFQRPQHLLTRAARTHQVLYWEEPEWRQDGEPSLELRTTPEGVTVAVPWLPWGADPDKEQRTLLERHMAQAGIIDPTLWMYSPHALDWASWVPGRPLVYDCMDELANFHHADPNLPAKERDLLARADLVFTGGRSLFEAKRAVRPDAHLFPSGVDASHFRPARGVLPEPADQRGIPHPRLGFYGVLDERLDQALLAGLAAARPDWHLVLIGPTAKIDPAALPQAGNVHLLGPKAYADLPAYLAGWDVALMPFALNEATRFISPTKTPEYLAGGCAVVSTPIADVVATYGNLPCVQIAGTLNEFVSACERIMALRRDTWLPQADAVLSGMSWDATWDRMAALIQAKRNEKG